MASRKASDSLRFIISFLLRFPGNVAEPLEGPLQTSAIGPGGVEILVVIVLLKFLHRTNNKL